MGLVPLQGPTNENLLPVSRQLTTTEIVVTLNRNPQGDYFTIAFLKDYPSTSFSRLIAKHRSVEQKSSHRKPKPATLHTEMCKVRQSLCGKGVHELLKNPQHEAEE